MAVGPWPDQAKATARPSLCKLGTSTTQTVHQAGTRASPMKGSACAGITTASLQKCTPHAVPVRARRQRTSLMPTRMYWGTCQNTLMSTMSGWRSRSQGPCSPTPRLAPPPAPLPYSQPALLGAPCPGQRQHPQVEHPSNPRMMCWCRLRQAGRQADTHRDTRAVLSASRSISKAFLDMACVLCASAHSVWRSWAIPLALTYIHAARVLHAPYNGQARRRA